MTNSSAAEGVIEQESDSLFGHPKGLYVLTVAEMWERFSFYGVRALFVLYLTQRFLLADNTSFAIYGSYMALVNMSPLIGGMLADRYLGFRKAVIFGGILIILGHIGLVLGDLYFAPHILANSTHGAHGTRAATQIFYLSLAFLVAGVGFFKPNITSMVGGLYPKGGYLSDSGFTIFCLGINLGSAIAAVICGYVGQRYGWAYGFGLAGLGVLIGLVTFILGKKHVRALGHPPRQRSGPDSSRIGLSQRHIIYALTILFIIMTWKLVQIVNFIGVLVGAIFILAFGGTVFYGFKYLKKVEREKLFCALILMTIWVFFAALVEQMGSSMNLFAMRSVNLHVALPHVMAQLGSGGHVSGLTGAHSGFTIQSSQLLGFPGLLILLFSPLFVWLWGYLHKRGLNPSTPVKFGLSLILLGAGFGVISLGAIWPNGHGQINLLWMLLCYLLLAIGDLFIAPVGLSAVIKLAATHIVGFMMGLWLLAVAIGEYFSARIAEFSSLPPALLHRMSPDAILTHYQIFFGYLALGSCLLGLIPLVLTPFLRKWMHGVP